MKCIAFETFAEYFDRQSCEPKRYHSDSYSAVLNCPKTSSKSPDQLKGSGINHAGIDREVPVKRFVQVE